MFRVGELSRLSQVTVKTLRYHDHTSLLQPAEVDRCTGCRGLGETYAALLAWIGTNGYHMLGPSQEITLRCPHSEVEEPEAVGYAEYLADGPDECVTEIQFPVERA